MSSKLMKRELLCSLISVVSLFALCYAGQLNEEHGLSLSGIRQSSSANAKNSRPNIEGLMSITKLPVELPQRVSALAYDGEKLWVAIYLDKGRYAVFDPKTSNWEISEKEEQHQSIREATGRYGSAGGMAFVDGNLWVESSYGESIGCIDTKDWYVLRLFKQKYREDATSQSYSGMAYDGKYLWAAWHWFRYDLPTSQTQLLLKIEPATGKVVSEHPLPAGTRNDGTHGLAWDGSHLWHMKDSKLSCIDPSNGSVIAQYDLNQIKRPSGLAWDGESLWIVEFRGTIWRLPFES